MMERPLDIPDEFKPGTYTISSNVEVRFEFECQREKTMAPSQT